MKYLTEGICQVSFTKVKDNSNRILLCTLNSNIIPTKYAESIGKTLQPTLDEDLLPVWEVSEGKWKSFRISKVNIFRTEDELTKPDKSGPDINSDQEKQLNDRKQKAINDFQERIQKQKEKAEEAKQYLKERNLNDG
jgi:4-diphosphocytidyl-2C-methyl-D-erythritol kinase